MASKEEEYTLGHVKNDYLSSASIGALPQWYVTNPRDKVGKSVIIEHN